MKKTIPLLFLLGMMGCQPTLNQEFDVQLKMLESKSYVVPPITQDRIISVSAKASSGGFSVYVFLEKDVNEAEQAINLKKPLVKVIAHKLEERETELKATIPANESAMVLIAATERKPAQVKLKITN